MNRPTLSARSIYPSMGGVIAALALMGTAAGGIATTSLPSGPIAWAGLALVVTLGLARHSNKALLIGTIFIIMLPGINPKLVSLPVDPRFAAIPWIALLFHRSRACEKRPLTRVQRFGTLAPAPVAVLALLSALWSVDPVESISTAAGLAMMTLVLSSTCRLLSHEEILSVVRLLGYLIIIPSLLVVLAGLDNSPDRVTGVFANPNGLAFILMLSLPALMRRRAIDLIVGVIGAILLVGAGSRASALGLTTALLYWLLATRQNRLKVGGLALTACAAVFVAQGFFTSMAGYFDGAVTVLTRTDDSRTGVWTNGIEVFQENKLGGVGAGIAPYNVGSSYIGAAATLGLPGLILTIAVATGIAVAALKTTPGPANCMILAGLVNSFFEGWLFSGGNGLTMAFWCALLALHNQDVLRPPLRASTVPSSHAQ